MKLQKFQEKVEVILDALPYIRQFQDAVVILKYGGSAMIDEELKKEVARDVSLMSYVGMKPIIVHGGGKEINAWLEKINKKPEFAPNGMRVTDAETMEVAEMVLGRISKEVVQIINVEGESRAISLSGKDGVLMKAKKMESEHDLGFVGEVTEVNTKLLEKLLAADYIPVISSIAVGSDNQTYNVNADYAACAIAKAMKATKLLLMTDVDGVLDKNGKLISRLTRSKCDMLIADGTITGGMIPKVTTALDVLDSGVKSVHIINGTIEHSVLLELLTSQGVGTMFSAEEL